jgi:hypothetical protein
VVVHGLVARRALAVRIPHWDLGLTGWLRAGSEIGLDQLFVAFVNSRENAFCGVPVRATADDWISSCGQS